MSFSFGYSPLLLVMLLALFGAVAYWGYANTTPRLKGPRQALLAGLRFVAFFLVLLLLFQPIVRRTASDVDSPVLAVLFDDSESIRLSAYDSTSGVFGALLEELRLPGGLDVQAYRFSDAPALLPSDRSAWSDSITATGDRTDIARALSDVQRNLRDRNLGAIVLVSDGRYNTGRNPIYVAERSSIPIHTVVVGDTTSRRDVALGRVAANRVAFVGVEQPVRVDLSATGFAGSRLSVTLRSRSRQLATESLTVDGDVLHTSVELSYVPDEEGLHNLAVSVTEFEGEVTHRNNTATFSVRVLDQKRQILLVGGAPGPDVAATRQILELAPDAELTVRVQKAAGVYYDGALPNDLASFDAVVLVGYPGPAASRSEVTGIRDAIEAGLPAFFILTRETDLDLLSRSLLESLPISVERLRPEWTDASIALTPAGAEHAVSAVDGAGADDWMRLPPLRVPTSRFQASPDAQVLATTDIRGVRLDDPLLVVRARSGARTAAFLGGGTWRWRNLPQDLDRWGHLWPTLVSNTVQWITADRDQRPVRVRPLRDVVAGGEPVQFVGEVYDERLQPVSDALVEVEIRDEEETSYPLRLESEGRGQYALAGVSLPTGIYSFSAVASRGGQTLGSDSGSFVVGGLALEHQDTSADPVLMRQIAHRSGGRALSAGDASALPEMISETATLEPRVVSVEHEFNLRRHPLFLLIIVALLTTEWVLRKRSGLV